MKRIIFIGLTFFSVLLLFIFIGEGLLRIFWNGKPELKSSTLSNYFHPDSDPDIGFVLEPNSKLKANGVNIFINESGFRMPGKIRYEKKKGLFRIALLGDSIIFGYKIADEFTISKRIEKYLKKYKFPGVDQIEVLNFGVPGYNMTQYLAALKKYAMRYKPDLVIVGLAVLNDFDGFFMSYLKRGNLNPIPVFDSKGFNYELKAPSRIFWKSYLFRYLYYKFTPGWEKLTKGPKNPPGENRRYRKRLPASCNRGDEIWADTENILDELSAISKKTNVDFLFLIFPTTEQVYYYNSRTRIPLKTQEIIVDLLNERGFSYIDLFDIFHSNYKASGQLPFIDVDAHPDTLGYSLTASLAVFWIAERYHLQLQDFFKGHLDLGDNSSNPFLSYGWTKVRADGSGYRYIEGSEARIVFDGFKDAISEIDIVARNMDGCAAQDIKFRLNGDIAGKVRIESKKDFNIYKIPLRSPIKLKELNSLDISLTCAALKVAKNSVKRKSSRGRFFSVLVKSLEIK